MALRRSAFTLVELLAVLAILAILGAVLFPVFQGVRNEAKKAKCLSNFRQAMLASSLYMGDYNEYYMPINHQPAEPPNSGNDRTWVQMILPYVRSFHVFQCPSDDSDRPRPESLFDQDLVVGDTYSQYYSASLRTNLGYNFANLAPVVLDRNRWIAKPRQSDGMRDPARTIVFVDSVWDRNEFGLPTGGGSWLVVPPCRYEPTAGGVLDTFTNSAGTSTKVYTPVAGWETLKDESAFRYGGAWPWHMGRMTVARADGSVASLSPVQLSAGCDVGPLWRGRITNPEEYLWDAN